MIDKEGDPLRAWMEVAQEEMLHIAVPLVQFTLYVICIEIITKYRKTHLVIRIKRKTNIGEDELDHGKPSHSVHCGGYSFEFVANSGSTKSPRLLPLTRMVDRGSGGQRRFQNGRPTGTIKSASRFDGASGS